MEAEEERLFAMQHAEEATEKRRLETIDKIQMTLMDQVFHVLHQEYGDIDKVRHIAEHLVRSFGVDSEPMAVTMAQSLIQSGRGKLQPIDAAYNAVLQSEAMRSMHGREDTGRDGPGG